MDIGLKYKIIEKIIQSNDDVLLNEIQSLVGLPEGDFWNEFPDEIKKIINTSITEHDKGEVFLHDQVMSEVKRRFLKQ